MSRIVLVGEAWGDREVRFAHPFVGPSGRELARMLTAAGLAPAMRREYPSELDMIAHWKQLRAESGIGLANVFDAHPVNNEILSFFDHEGNHDLPGFRVGGRVGYIRQDMMHHVIRLWDFIRSEQPNLVVAMGNSACWALLGQTKITALRGTVQMSERLGVKVLPTFHPAAVLRQWSMRPTTVADLTKARRESEYPEIRRTERWITIPSPDESGIREIAAWFNRPAAAYANDIETAFGQISMTSFARNPSDACVIPFHADSTGISFWPTVELEVAAWRLVLRGLKRSVRKIGQNWLYDLGYYIRMGITPSIPAMDDTMLRHHSMFPELPKALGYLGSLYTSEVAWKLVGRTNPLKRDE